MSSAMKTPENTEEGPESADEGDNYMQYSSVKLYSPSIGAVAKTCH
jgi:hypothetical protein